MIKSGEVHKIANKDSVSPQQIEKDYIISWLLWGIASSEFLKQNLIFKGGTCLKKMYIENFRYSEDLDFTLFNDKENNDDLLSAIKEMLTKVSEETRIYLSIEDNTIETHNSSGSLKFYIQYIGPLGGKGDHLKVDITRREKIVFDTTARYVNHNYSDLSEQNDFSVIAYSLEEILIEKMVALMGRTIPRDLYDFDYLTCNSGIELADIYYEFEVKARHKGHKPEDFNTKVEAKEGKYNSDWDKNLTHQIKDISKFKDVWRSVKKQFRIIEKIKGS